MNLLPSPLHPAIVHFPIVLILLGALAAAVAAFTSRWHLRGMVAVVLALGALGTVIAVTTGDEDGEAVEHDSAAGLLLKAHETWAERTELASLIAAALAIAAVATARWPDIARLASMACAAGALVASACVYQTGHHGGQLVYRHGAGVNLAPAASVAAAAPSVRRERHHQSDRERE